MDIPTLDQILSHIDAFLERHDMKPSRFGRDAIGEASLISTMREGRQPSLDTLRRLKEFMDEKDAAIGAAPEAEAAE
jgi:hypothetical protein